MHYVVCVKLLTLFSKVAFKGYLINNWLNRLSIRLQSKLLINLLRLLQSKHHKPQNITDSCHEISNLTFLEN